MNLIERLEAIERQAGGSKTIAELQRQLREARDWQGYALIIGTIAGIFVGVVLS